MNYEVTRSLFGAGVSLYGADPAGGTMLAPGRLAFEMPLSNFAGKTATHLGDLTFTRGYSSYYRTAVLNDVRFDFGKKKATARIWATDTALGKVTMFSLAHVKSQGPSTSFTLKLTADGAKVLNDSLGVAIFSGGMRFGAGSTTTIG